MPDVVDRVSEHQIFVFYVWPWPWPWDVHEQIYGNHFVNLEGYMNILIYRNQLLQEVTTGTYFCDIKNY